MHILESNRAERKKHEMESLKIDGEKQRMDNGLSPLVWKETMKRGKGGGRKD